MVLKYTIFYLCFISQIVFIHSSSDDPVYNGRVWTAEDLYDYTSRFYLNENNPHFAQNIKYMVVDPENYLQYADLRDAYQSMMYLLTKYKISTHIFFISHIHNKYSIEEEYPSFVSKLTFMLYKNYKEYNAKRTLTAVFFIKDRKMRINTSRDLREILTDEDNLKILNRRKNDLIKFNYQEVVNGLMKDVINLYERKIKNHEKLGDDNNASIIFTIVFIVIIAVLVSLFNKEKKVEQGDKIRIFLDKLKQKQNPKEIFTESCAICLDDFVNGVEEENSVLECGHKFHRKCISDWLKKDSNCPICRMRFDIKENDNNANNANSGNNLNFQNILTEILRIQSELYMLNQNEINRIKNIYNPNNSNISDKEEPHNKSYSSLKKESGGATSGW
jgi:hypothetical protein